MCVILKIGGRRAKRTNIWASGGKYLMYKGTFEFYVFKVILSHSVHIQFWTALYLEYSLLS